jgi:outer membrane protein assembly factor BamB
VIAESLLFMIANTGGLVSCLDANTGTEIWRERLGHGGNHWASPLFVGDKICFFSKEGYVTAHCGSARVSSAGQSQVR